MQVQPEYVTILREELFSFRRIVMYNKEFKKAYNANKIEINQRNLYLIILSHQNIYQFDCNLCKLKEIKFI